MLQHTVFLASFESIEWTDKILLGLMAVLVAVLGFYLGGVWMRLRSRKEQGRRKEQMFIIEKSLADFFEHERGKLLEQKDALEREVERLKVRVEEYRKKAAGVGGRLTRDARSDLLLNLLAENEALQEKLFEQNLRHKEDSDRHLKRELQALSYQRVLLSRLLEERNVRDAVVEVLGDDAKLRDLQAATPRLEAGGGRGSNAGEVDEAAEEESARETQP